MKAVRNVVLVALFAVCVGFAANVVVPKPPQTRRDQVTETIDGVKISDPYRWLEDQKGPETRAWINAQNEYTHSILDSLPGRDALRERFGQLLKVETVDAPVERNGRFFFRKRGADQDQAVINFRDGLNGKDQVLIDPNPMSPDHTTAVEIGEVANSGKLLLYELRSGGRDETEVRLYDVDAHKDTADVLPPAVYFDFSMLPDASGFYYSLMTDDGPRVRFHKIGTPPATDKEIFGKGYGKDKIVVGDVSPDGRYLVIQVLYGSAADKTEVWVSDLKENAEPKPIIKDIDARFSASPGGDTLFVQTNWNAPKNKIIAIDLKDPARDKWRDVVPEGPDTMENASLAGGKIVITYVHNASSQVAVFDANGKPAGKVALPALGSVAQVNSRWDQPNAFLFFSSYIMAPQVLTYEVAKERQSVFARVKVPLQPDEFQTEQVWYRSKDGTKVPMFLVHKKGLKLDGSNPTLLTGYGGFNVNIMPRFNPTAVVWAEHGGVFAEANLRGGGEFGEQWHRAGMLDKKQNVFDDFIGAAEYLIAQHYTQPAKLAILGGSNGGLLVGAAMTQRPDLFRAVVCWHPLLDMLRYQKFMEAAFWVSEYGSSDNPQQFKYIYAYSPYQHVKPGAKYPAVLFMSGDGDTRVAPLHARKMTALMQTTATPERPVMLRYELKAGHAGGRSVTDRIKDSVDELSFLFWQLGVKQ
jgi:prolyl oligopeptidase